MGSQPLVDQRGNDDGDIIDTLRASQINIILITLASAILLIWSRKSSLVLKKNQLRLGMNGINFVLQASLNSKMLDILPILIFITHIRTQLGLHHLINECKYFNHIWHACENSTCSM
jgi:hypothetical protein